MKDAIMKTRIETEVRKSDDSFMHRLDQQLPSFSRTGVVQDILNPISKCEPFLDIKSRLQRNPHLFIGRTPRTPIQLRVTRALEIESRQSSESPVETRVRNSSNFVSTSREYHQRRVHSDAPPLGTYHPRYDVLLKTGPKILFGKAETTRFREEKRCESEEPGLLCSRSKIGNKRKNQFRLPGIAFEKQVKRAEFVDPRKGPNEGRFMMAVRSSVDRAQVHSFASYSPRLELFPGPSHLPDYDPKYTFISRRKMNISSII